VKIPIKNYKKEPRKVPIIEDMDEGYKESDDIVIKRNFP
jgi:hypothetical protein